MNFLDLLPDDVIEKINYHLSKLDINEKEVKERKKERCKKKRKKWLSNINLQIIIRKSILYILSYQEF